MNTYSQIVGERMLHKRLVGSGKLTNTEHTGFDGSMDYDTSPIDMHAPDGFSYKATLFFGSSE